MDSYEKSSIHTRLNSISPFKEYIKRCTLLSFYDFAEGRSGRPILYASLHSSTMSLGKAPLGIKLPYTSTHYMVGACFFSPPRESSVPQAVAAFYYCHSRADAMQPFVSMRSGI